MFFLPHVCAHTYMCICADTSLCVRVCGREKNVKTNLLAYLFTFILRISNVFLSHFLKSYDDCHS